MTMQPKSFPIMTADGEVKYNCLSREILESIETLPLQHDRYFVIGPTAIYPQISQLVFRRARPEGVANANALMREAAAGQVDRRAPIRVRSLKDGRWLVIDGNSTGINALFSDWPDIPAEIERSVA
jgi:hypothetical protein